MKRKTILCLLIGLLALPSMGAAMSVTSVDFKTLDTKSRLQIGVDGQAVYDVLREGNTVRLKLENARIPASLARPFVTRDFKTAVEQILPQQTGTSVTFEITMKQMAPYFVSQDRQLLIMDFDIPAEILAAAQESAPVVEVRSGTTVSAAEEITAQPAMPQQSGFSKRAHDLSATMVEASAQPQYTGQKISLDFQNADIHNVLRIIADVSGLNIVTSDDVTGTITIRLKDVPWDQALDVILESKDLGKMAVGNVVRIAPATKIKAAKERQLSERKTEEKLEPLVTSVIPVNFAKASAIASTIKGKQVGMVSDRGSITAEDRTNVLIVKDIKKNVDSIFAMIKRLDKPTPQVLIQARIVQADDDFKRGLGVQWGGNYRQQTDSWHYGLSGLQTGAASNLFSSTTTPGNAPNWSTSVVPQPAFAINFPTGMGSGFGVTLGRLGGSLFDLDMRLDIGEDIGQAKVIARPKVVTLDNKKATIRQGEKYPYIVRDENGELSTELKDIELVLEVTPRIAFDGTVNMEVSVKRNAIGSVKNQLGDPSIASREVETEIMVKDGETSVIGGIIEEEVLENSNKIPGLGNVPVIGYLFRGKTTTKNKKELLIFITPSVIETGTIH